MGRTQVWLDAPIKAIGQTKVTIAVHPEVEATINVTVARSADEAERIKRGEDISTRQEDQDAAAEAIAAAGEFFDPEAQRDDVQPAPLRRPKPSRSKTVHTNAKKPGLESRAFYFVSEIIARSAARAGLPAAPAAAPVSRPPPQAAARPAWTAMERRARSRR